MTEQRLALRLMAPGEINIPATVAVLNDAFRRHAFLGTDRTSADTIGEELHASSRLVQAFEGNDLVGTGAVTPALDEDLDAAKFPGIDLSHALYFGMAAVRRDRMGRGVGAQILAESERVARQRGDTHIILMTVREMGNVAYYHRFAYETVSVHELPAGYWGLTIPTHEHAMAKIIIPHPDNQGAQGHV
jgi:predicted N-acetyltransferase YhbS